jgi:hypothetical protein
MKPKFLLKLVFVSMVLDLSLRANAQIWIGDQLGNPGVLGSVVTNREGTLTIAAGGDDIGNASDNGYFYFTWIQTDFEVKARVVSLDTANCPGAKVGLIVRNSDPLVNPQGNDGFVGIMCAAGQPTTANQNEYRPQRAASATNDLTPNATFPLSFPNNWLRIVKTNRVVTMWAGSDGATWTELAQVNTAGTNFGFGSSPWPDLVTVGVAVTAHNNGTTTTAVVSQPLFVLNPPSPRFLGTLSAHYVTQANGQPGIHIEWTNTIGFLSVSTNLIDWHLVDTYTNSVTNDITSPRMFYRVEGFIPP